MLDTLVENEILAKFGGWSVETAEEIERSVDIIIGKFDGIPRKYVVNSAPGGTPKITDLLINLANYKLGKPESTNSRDTSKEILDKFYNIIDDLHINQDIREKIEKELSARLSYSKQNEFEYKDQLKAFGEWAMWEHIMPAAIERKDKKVKKLSPEDIEFFVTETFEDARVLEDSYPNMERKIREATAGFDGIILLPGYYGVSNGKIVTFQRGGSDTVANIYAKAAGVDLIENWTNQNGIGRLSPQMKQNGHDVEIVSIDKMTYEEAVLLSNAGFTVLHPDSIKPAKDKSIPIRVRNFKNPSHPGTLIIADVEPTSLITGIAYKGGFASVSYRNPFDIELQNDVITYLRSALSEKGIRPSFITSQNGESLIYDKQKLDETKLNEARKQAISSLKEKRPDLVKELDEIVLVVDYGISLVSVVGRGMRYDRETAGTKIFEGIKTSGIDARLVSDEPINKMYLINENPLVKEPEKAMKVAAEIYKQFFPNHQIKKAP